MMRRVFYANAHVVTTDAVARALMEYAHGLAICDSSDVVEIPVLDPAGVARTAELLIGSCSGLFCLEVDDIVTALPWSEQTVDELRRRHRVLLPPIADLIEAHNTHLD